MNTIIRSIQNHQNEYLNYNCIRIQLLSKDKNTRIIFSFKIFYPFYDITCETAMMQQHMLNKKKET